MTSNPLAFFISYNSADRAWAEWIAWQLEADGHTTRIQAWDFRPGSNFVLEMHEAAKAATRTLCVLSNRLLSSDFTAAEWAASFRGDAAGRARALVPVRVEECDPVGLLGPIVYVDLVGLGESEARARLIAGVSPDRAKPRARPRFPSDMSGTIRATPDFPGQRGGVIWCVPVPTRTFSGREGVIASVGERLRVGAVSLTQAAAIHGLGGVGKTQLAARFARMNRDEYEVVWWIRAETETTLIDDYCELGVVLGLLAAGEAFDLGAAKKVLRWLESNSGWLLIFDNATDPRPLAPLIPEGPAGHVLITSRKPTDWQQIGATVLALDVWSRSEAIEFLLRRTGRNDSRGAHEVASLLGDLPLALEQAAAYVIARGIAFEEYTERWSARAEELLSEGAPMSYDKTVLTTWQLAFDELKDQPATAVVLAVCSVLSADPVPRFILQAIASADPETIEQAVGSLASYGLFSAQGTDDVVVHRLVSHVIRSRLLRDDETHDAVLAIALKALYGCFPRDVHEPNSWPEFRRLHAHAAALLAAIPDATATPRAATLRFLVASWYGVHLRLAEAIDEWQRVLAIESRLYGQQHPFTVRSHANLGSAFAQLEKWEEAENHLRVAIELSEVGFGPDSAQAASEMETLAVTFARQGKTTKARDLFEKALATFTRLHPAAREEPFLKRALVTTRLNLATTLRDLGLVDEELAELCRADRDARDLFRSPHPIHGTVRTALGNCLAARGTLAEAERHLAAAVRLNEAFASEPLGALQTAKSLEALARLLLTTGRAEEASEALARELALLRAHRGNKDRSLIEPLGLRAVAQAGMGEAPAGVATLKQALDIAASEDDDPSPALTIDSERFDHSSLADAGRRLLEIFSRYARPAT